MGAVGGQAVMRLCRFLVGLVLLPPLVAVAVAMLVRDLWHMRRGKT